MPNRGTEGSYMTPDHHYFSNVISLHLLLSKHHWPRCVPAAHWTCSQSVFAPVSPSAHTLSLPPSSSSAICSNVTFSWTMSVAETDLQLKPFKTMACWGTGDCNREEEGVVQSDSMSSTAREFEREGEKSRSSNEE
ncbi:unnamed protein product [Rangifer tarandus platyrhynchus]|uniref:Uncharacterized protein n=1 Tax=Rangifer tarandus platyrhynchus TaxID=3082113 RepID=A0AC59Y222_RANTA